MKYYISIFIMFIISIQISFSQKTSLKELAVGEKFPDIEIKNVINIKQKTLRLADYRGKWIILDYWNVHCGSCIAAFPKIENLVKQHNTQLAVFTYTQDSKAAIERLQLRSSIARSTTLPIIYDDRTLVKFFRTMYPHQIWIDPRGYIRYITDVEHLNRRDVSAILCGKKVDMVNVSLIRDFDYAQPLPFIGNGQFNRYTKQFAYLSGYVDGVGGTNYAYDSISKKQTGYYSHNTAIIMLFKEAYKKRVSLNNNDGWDFRGIILDVKNPMHYMPPSANLTEYEKLEWQESNSYCYGIKTDPDSKISFSDQLCDDLNRQFHVNTSVVKKMTTCWVLIRTDSTDKMHTAGINSESNSTIENDSLFVLRNAPIFFLVKFLLFDPLKDPFSPIVLDETGYEGRIDINLKVADTKNEILLNQALAKYGLAVVKKERDLQFLDITERN